MSAYQLNNMSGAPSINQEDFDSIKKHIIDIRIAMMTTQDTNGSLRTRPMATHQFDPDGTMWFFTRANSAKVDHIRHNPAVALSFSDPQSQVSVSTGGQATVVRDQAKVDELWNEDMHDWFPEGKDDPNIVLLRVTTQTGECWE